MTRSDFIDLVGGPAVCRVAGAADRGIARRLLGGHHPVPAIARPDVAAVNVPGRVFGLGRFRDPAVSRSLRAALPETLRAALRPDLEWYACCGAFFHNDAHYGEVLFGAWCIDGPRREIVFARSGVRVPAGPGDWAVFDPFEPHGVLDEGAVRYERQRYVGAPASIFIGFELALDAKVLSEFGIASPAAGTLVLASGTAINAETGALR